MRQSPVTVTFNPINPLNRLRRRWQEALPKISEQILADCNRYVRDDSGRLRQSSAQASSLAAGKLIWITPYARRVYYTGQPSHARNPNASLRWCEKARGLHASAWAALVRQKLGGGKT